MKEQSQTITDIIWKTKISSDLKICDSSNIHVGLKDHRTLWYELPIQ